MERRSRSRSRSRSPSPPDNRWQDAAKRNNGSIDRDKLERERRERMARLRSENDAEERGLTPEEEEAAGAVAAAKKKRHHKETSKKTKDDDSEEEPDDEQAEMMHLMGFGGFGTTKGKVVMDNQTSAARGAASKNKGRKYRQYMNRKGGFNRPLNKMN
ncbi:hypothetical protein ACHAWO_001992 [Cyclotella atomus]|uniref:U4/U6.U5 small nuclear ribonucleoprotein 27kDa protein domain-containing protein n=1 Tax=Cyclotella atomus TaxID=382360 RepID=A0ABD3NJ84_9STRA